MASGQPFSVSLSGGLDKSTNSLELLRTPGVATKLRNFEVSIEGGYRRINGYSLFGGDSAAKRVLMLLEIIILHLLVEVNYL
jgi:hypothetical protein